MSTRDVTVESILFSQHSLWPVTLIPKSESEEICEESPELALTVIEIGSDLVALNNNVLVAIARSSVANTSCNVYDGKLSDFYMQANCGYRLMWEQDAKLQVIAFHPKDLAALIALRCGTGSEDYPLTGSHIASVSPASLEEAARRGVVPFPESPSMDRPPAAFDALAAALATDIQLYISTSGNLYFPINASLRTTLGADAKTLIVPTVLFTYSTYSVSDLTNSEEVDDVEWVTGGYVEVMKEEISRDRDLAEHLVSCVLWTHFIPTVHSFFVFSNAGSYILTPAGLART